MITTQDSADLLLFETSPETARLAGPVDLHFSRGDSGRAELSSDALQHISCFDDLLLPNFGAAPRRNRAHVS